MCKIGDIIVVENKSYVITNIYRNDIEVIDYNKFIQSFFEEITEFDIKSLNNYDYIFGSLNNEGLQHLIKLIHK